MKKLLVTGGHGLVGSSITADFKTGREFDLTNFDDVDTMLASIVSETSSRVTCEIYTDLSDKPNALVSHTALSEDYKNRAGNIVYHQIRKAGIRLASLLNSITYYRTL